MKSMLSVLANMTKQQAMNITTPFSISIPFPFNFFSHRQCINVKKLNKRQKQYLTLLMNIYHRASNPEKDWYSQQSVISYIHMSLHNLININH